MLEVILSQEHGMRVSEHSKPTWTRPPEVARALSVPESPAQPASPRHRRGSPDMQSGLIASFEARQKVP